MFRKNSIIKLVIIVTLMIAQSTLTSANPGITVDVTPVTPQVAPPGTATYSVTVTSSSTETERVTLSIVNPNAAWTYSFSENDFELTPAGTPGATKTVELSINVPRGTPNGDYLHDVRGFAVVPGYEGVFDEETFFLNVLTQAIPEFPAIALPIISVLGIMLLMSRRKGKGS